MKKTFFVIFILAAAGLTFIAGMQYGKDQPQLSATKQERQILYYIDPMTPGFRSDKPGIAPCGMPLEPVYAETGDQHMTASGTSSRNEGAVRINSARQQLIGVEVGPVSSNSMTYTLRLYGKVVPEESKIYNLNTSTDSWVQKLSDLTTGSLVKKDQILAEVLDPDFYTAQVTYLVSLKNLDRYRDKLGDKVRLRQIDLADNQMRVAIQDIQDFGISDAQIEELTKTGKAESLLQVRSPIDGVILRRSLSLNQWVKAGDDFYQIADIGKVWVYADVYEEEATHLRPGMAVKVKHPKTGMQFDATVSEVLPLFDPLANTLKVRLEVDNPRYDLRPDMFVDVEIPVTMPPSIHVPADAVIDSGMMKVVYVEVGDSTFEPRRVETGWRLGRQIEITDGLAAGDKIVVSGNFLIDSESRMKLAAAGIHGPTSIDPVCGMNVDEETAGMSGRKTTYAGMNFYFCRKQCKESFEQEPQKYIHTKDTDSRGEYGTTLDMKNQSWLDMLKGETKKEDSRNKGTGPATPASVPDEAVELSAVDSAAAGTTELPGMAEAKLTLSVPDNQENLQSND